MSASVPSVDLTRSASLRRHDLDALRAFAMLLGIVLHASLSFSTIPWVVRDTRQSELYSVIMQALHGFRLPLFFLVSGLFTTMLWRRRGLASLLKQRAVRILVPCLVGLVTIIPLLDWVSEWARQHAIPVVASDDDSITAAVRLGDSAALRERLLAGLDVNQRAGTFGVPPLGWAAMLGDTAAAQLLIDAGADVRITNRDGSTPLHGAAIFGRAEVAALLLKHGANPNARNREGRSALDATTVDWGTTQFVAKLLQIRLGTEPDVDAGRAEVRRLLAPITQSTGDTTRSAAAAAEKGGGIVKAYRRLLDSDRLTVQVGGSSFNLIRTPVFDHLWFLWFLCWLVPIFALLAWAAQRLHLPRVPRGLLHSPICYLWLLPLTFIPQWFMGDGIFGPDTSIGLLPLPHLLVYYGIFFGFGALYYDTHDDEGRLARRWWFLLPLALIVALPLGLVPLLPRAVTALAQVVYAWAMSFGMLGLFRRVLRRERPWVRYVSDSSYWLYVTHPPLVIAAQVIVAPWPLPAYVKFVLICSVVTAILLLTYQLFVRYTWIGFILNGRRTRPRGETSHSDIGDQVRRIG
ncbi:MAG TPA: acyltransferase family protein [Pirellulales bacterium]|nr:acyltransferase family protein [Pirellulales bacterium]